MNKTMKQIKPPTIRQPLLFETFADFFGVESGLGVIHLLIGKTMSVHQDHKEYVGMITIMPQTLLALEALIDVIKAQFKTQGLDLDKKYKNAKIRNEVNLPQIKLPNNGKVDIQ